MRQQEIDERRGDMDHCVIRLGNLDVADYTPRRNSRPALAAEGQSALFDVD